MNADWSQSITEGLCKKKNHCTGAKDTSKDSNSDHFHQATEILNIVNVLEPKTNQLQEVDKLQKNKNHMDNFKDEDVCPRDETEKASISSSSQHKQ